MAGQSVGMVTKEEPLVDIVALLIGEASAALEKRAA
jgi:enoyl-[acyl-carrier protein] reductase II